MLQEVPELARWLIASVERAPAAAASAPIEVFTQGAMAGEGQPDLHIYCRDESASSVYFLASISSTPN